MAIEPFDRGVLALGHLVFSWFRPMPITIREVAEECGVSRQTVSYALSNSGRLKPTTRKRVIEAAQRLGYRPNGSAKIMRTGKFNALGLLVSTQFGRGFIFERVSWAMRTALREHDLQLVIGDLPDRELVDESVLPKLLREWLVDGLVVSYTHHIPQTMLELVEQYNIPAVWLNAKLHHDCIYPDDYGAGRLAAQSLMDAGHKRLAYLRYNGRQHYSSIDRQQGFVAAAREAGLTPEINAPAEPPPPGERLADCRQWLEGPDRPTAVFCYERDEAITLYAAAMSLGLRVPEDLSVIAVSDAPICQIGVRIDTVLIPAEGLGRGCVEMSIRKMQDPSSLDCLALPFDLCAGVTVAPPVS